MNVKNLLFGLTLLASVPLHAAEPAKGSAADITLKPGNYTATAKAMVCEGCAQFITDGLKTNPNVDSIAVDPKTKTVAFSVKPGAQVKLSDLQRALKAKSDEMGMGANYALSDVKAVKKS